MKTNMGSIDKALRIFFAIVVGILIYTKTLTGVLAIVLSILSIVFVLTSLVGFCPLYALFGIRTVASRTKK
jgi:hypothetical protein